MESTRVKWKVKLLILGILAAFAVALTWMPTPARAATIEQRLDKLERQNQAQARRIHSLERLTAEQGAKLGWFKECTPGPLDIGLFLDEELENRFNIISQALADPAIAWQPLAWPIGANTFALQVHPSCIKGSISGFPW
jgi:hypothetical protein